MANSHVTVYVEWRIQQSNDSGLWNVVSRLLLDTGRCIGYGPMVTFTNHADAQDFYARLYG